MGVDLLSIRERVARVPRDGTIPELVPRSDDGGGACRVCGGNLHRFIDLGMSPLCDRLLPSEERESAQMFYPLIVTICERCWLAQHRQYVAPTEIYPEYANTCSVSESLVAHARAYVDDAVRRFGLGQHSRVIEVGSNDGYLLRHVVAHGIPCLGIEPSRILARESERAGVTTICDFFTAGLVSSLIARNISADLLVANNCLPEFSDLKDFAAAVAMVLAPGGVATFEVPHLMRLIQRNQFDTIYHENLWYFSLHALENLLDAHGLHVFDLEELETQGGSLRVFCCSRDSHWPVMPTVSRVRSAERKAGLGDVRAYRAFGTNVIETKRKLLELLLVVKRLGGRIAAYGAPGKGCMLMNYCGIRGDIVDYTVDRNPHKHGHYLPGTRIQVDPVERLYVDRPDYVLILPWNLEQEIVTQLDPLRERGTKLIVPIPEPRIVS